MRGQQFLTEVESWIGTPFHQQQAAKGKGCDCKGLLWGAARELDFPEAETPYAQFIDYDLTTRAGLPHQLLREGMAAVFDRVTDPEPGDILLCRHGGVPGHLAVFDGEDAIHTQIDSKAWVKRTKLRVLLRVYPLDSVWRWRELNGSS